MDENGSTLNDYLSTLGQLGSTAGEIVGKFNRPPSVVPPAQAQQPKTNFGLIAVIGGAILAVIVLVVLLGRK